MRGLGGNDVSASVPGDAAEEARVVEVVPEPGTLGEQVDGVNDLLLGGGADQLLLVAPHLEQAGLRGAALHHLALALGPTTHHTWCGLIIIMGDAQTSHSAHTCTALNYHNNGFRAFKAKLFLQWYSDFATM